MSHLASCSMIRIFSTYKTSNGSLTNVGPFLKKPTLDRSEIKELQTSICSTLLSEGSVLNPLVKFTFRRVLK